MVSQLLVQSFEQALVSNLLLLAALCPRTLADEGFQLAVYGLLVELCNNRERREHSVLIRFHSLRNGK